MRCGSTDYIENSSIQMQRDGTKGTAKSVKVNGVWIRILC